MTHAPADRAGVHAPHGDIRVVAVRGVPEIHPGDDVAALIGDSLDASAIELRPYDVVVVAHKVVSKAEGRVVNVASVIPSPRAIELAESCGFDARHVEVILSESTRVLRAEHVLICETRHGLVCANAGVDLSNADSAGVATLLPLDPDASAVTLQQAWLRRASGGPLGVIVSDTFGRPFRQHGVNVAIGVAGMPAMTPHEGERDATGYAIHGSAIATADEVASAVELVMGKVDGVPAAVVRGLEWAGEGSGRELIRDPATDLFRR